MSKSKKEDGRALYCPWCLEPTENFIGKRSTGWSFQCQGCKAIWFIGNLDTLVAAYALQAIVKEVDDVIEAEKEET